MFQDIAEDRDVLAVPAIFKDGQFFEGGKQTMDTLLDKIAGGKSADDFADKAAFDVLIIGGGPAAATAAIYAARKLSLIHISEPTRRLMASRMPSSA